MRQFCGWIPTITGNLSFSVLGTSQSPKKVEQDYKIVGPRRFTVAAQRRKTSDALFGVADLFNKKVSTFHFVLMSVSLEEEGHDVNTGNVFVLDSRDYWRFKHHLDAVRSASDEEYEKFFHYAILGLQTAVDRRMAVKLKISAHRKGRVLLTSFFEDCVQDTVGVIENQVYYFLRDISHQHQHHEASSDTILKCYEFKECSEAGQQKWKRETLYALFRWVIQQKRSQARESYINCKGVLAYAKSFESLYIERSTNLGASAVSYVPNYNFETTLGSLNASIERLNGLNHPRFGTAFLNQVLPLLGVILAGLGPIASGFGGYQGSASKSPQLDILHGAFNYIVDYPIFTICACFLPLAYFVVDRTARKYLFPRLRPLQRLSISVGYWVSLSYLALLLFSFTYAFYSLLT